MKYLALSVALALSFAALPAQLALAQQAPPPSQSVRAGTFQPRPVVVILAHPDDELPFAPALAFEARKGHPVTLVYATTGDKGPGVSGMQPGAELGRKRMQEASCAQRALGAKKVISLDLGDGTLGLDAQTEGSSAGRLLAELPRLLKGAKTVFTWGPEGGYGHSDHRVVGAVVTQYVQSLPKSDRPFLKYPAFTKAPLPDILQKQGWTITARDLATTSYGYTSADLAAANAAAQCYKTQFDEATRQGMMPLFDTAVWQRNVDFRPAF
jgi:LmbE family N-acetylglucosaminyl deacetylase